MLRGESVVGGKERKESREENKHGREKVEAKIGGERDWIYSRLQERGRESYERNKKENRRLIGIREVKVKDRYGRKEIEA